MVLDPRPVRRPRPAPAGDLVAESRARPYSAERCVVSLDAYTMAHQADGLERCRQEVIASPTDVARLRTQRVLTFMLLSAPVGEGLAEAIADLSVIDHPEAEIESLRFSATLAAREGRFDAVPALLDHVSRAVAARYPGQEAWYVEIARRVLVDCPATRHLVDARAEAPRFFEHPVNQSVVDLSGLWHQLDGGEVNAATTPMIRQLVTQLSTSSAHAIEILHLLALGRVEAAGDRLRPFRGQLATRPRESLAHLLLVAAGRVAVATRDGHLAAEVGAAAEPFAGEWLGVWPFDLIIEPADRLLDTLRSLR